MRDATITPHLMKPWMKRSGQYEATLWRQFVTEQNGIKRENLLDIIMRFLTSLSQSIIQTAQRDKKCGKPPGKGESLSASGPQDRERERKGRHNRKMEEDIGRPWQQKREIYLTPLDLGEDATLVPFGKRGDLLVLSAEGSTDGF